MQHLQGDSLAAQTLVLQITMAPVHRHTSQTSFSQHLQSDSEPARTNAMEITMAVVHRHSVRTSWPQPFQCDSQPVTTIALQITMAVTHRAAGGPAATTRAAAPSGGSGYCACHCRERGGPSGHNARRKHPSRSLYTATPNRKESILLWKSQWQWCTDTVCTHPGRSHYNAIRSLSQPLLCKSQWQSRTEPEGAQRRQRAPQPLLEALGTAPATAESEGNPAATTRAAAPSGGSGYCACHCRERGGPSGDNARRSPFWRLWLLRLPLQRARGAQRRHAPQPLLEALATAPATAESEGGPAATTGAAAPWRLWVLRLSGVSEWSE